MTLVEQRTSWLGCVTGFLEDKGKGITQFLYYLTCAIYEFHYYIPYLLYLSNHSITIRPINHESAKSKFFFCAPFFGNFLPFKFKLAIEGQG